MSAAAAIKFLESLKISEGPLAGKRIKLGQFQKKFIRGALADGVSIAALSVGRGAGKTMLGSGLALGALLGKIDRQKRREVIIGAKTRDQGRIAWNFIEGLAESLPIKDRKLLTFVRSPRLEVRYEGGFRVPAGGERIERRGNGLVRTVTTATLSEFSAVARPAYPQAQIEARNWKPEGASHVAPPRALARWRV